MKRYFPLFTNALDVDVVNAHALYTALNENISLLDFRRNIARTYLKKESLSNRKVIGKPSSSITRKSRVPEGVRFDPIEDILERSCEGKQRKCAICDVWYKCREGM